MMKIQPTMPAALTGLTQLSGGQLGTLKALVGQTLPITITQTTAGQVNFQLNGQTYQAQTGLNLKPNDRLQVQVEQHQGQIRLTIQPQRNAPQETLQAHYRQLLPQQMSLQQTLQFLSQPQLLQQLPAAVQTQLNALIEQILRPQQPLDGKRVKQALLNSGLFFENKLTRPDPKLNTDTKAQLFKLQHGLAQNTSTPSLTQALTLIGQSLNKITLNQIQQIENPLQLQAELPLQHEDDITPLQLEIRKQTHPNQWEAILYLSLHEEQGVICKITWVDERYFNGMFFIENADLRDTFQQALPELKTMFDDAGLPVKLLQTTPVKPTFSQNAQKIGLIDIKI